MTSMRPPQQGQGRGPGLDHAGGRVFAVVKAAGTEVGRGDAEEEAEEGAGSHVG